MSSLSPVAVRTRELLPVLLDTEIDGDRADDLYEIYQESFAHLRTQAAARQLLTRDEFLAEMADARITKYTAWRSERDPVALATVTNQLEAVAWISPDFYAARYPAQAARDAVYYLGFGLVAPGHGQFRLLERLLHELVKPCVAAKGVLAFDICRFNDQTVQFARRTETALRRVAPVQVSVVDVQTYYQAVFE